MIEQFDINGGYVSCLLPSKNVSLMKGVCVDINVITYVRMKERRPVIYDDGLNTSVSNQPDEGSMHCFALQGHRLLNFDKLFVTDDDILRLGVSLPSVT